MLKNPNLRAILLLAVVVVFATSSIIAYNRYFNTSNLLAVTLKGGSWSASELENETDKFIHSLELFSLGGTPADTLQFRMEMLWARLNILLTGSETKEVRELPDAQSTLTSLLDNLSLYEEYIYAADSLSKEELASMISAFKALLPEIRKLNVRSFSGPERTKELQKAYDTQEQFGIYLFGLLISGAMLILLTLIESLRNRHLAMFDELTKLPNRKSFNHEMARLQTRVQRGELSVAVCLVDLNDFKGVNDSLGHYYGDHLLVIVAERIRQSCDKGAYIARWGGDEFAILLDNKTPKDDLAPFMEKLHSAICAPMDVDHNRIHTSASIGVSFCPDHNPLITGALANADLAMYSAKTASDRYYCLYMDEMDRELRRRERLSRDLMVALRNDGMELHFQPIIDMTSGTICGAEALIRWYHPEDGYISPLEVVSIAEQYGHALLMNNWVLDTACKFNKMLDSHGFIPISISVNISPSMYTKHDLVSSVRQALTDNELNPSQLIVEVTEDTTMQDIGASPHIMRDLHALGISLALDDFGTGYSSLSQLKSLPIQRLKIDKSFVQSDNHGQKDIQLLNSVVRLAESLDIKTVAEGIETPEQHQRLLTMGCNFGQGYLYSKPLPPAQFISLMQQNNGQPLVSRKGKTLRPESISM